MITTARRRTPSSRSMVTVTLRMPQGVVEDLKRLAPKKAFAGYQSLLRSYVGAGLHQDLLRYENATRDQLAARLRREGVAEAIIARVLNDAAWATLK